MSCSASGLRGFLIQIVEDVPAQDAVDAARSCGNRFDRNAGNWSSMTVTDVTVDVLRQIFDDDLAAELLAEETDVGADDRTESRSTGCERALRPAMKRASTFVGWTGASDGTSLRLGVFLATTGEQIGERHRSE